MCSSNICLWSGFAEEMKRLIFLSFAGGCGFKVKTGPFPKLPLNLSYVGEDGGEICSSEEEKENRPFFLRGRQKGTFSSPSICLPFAQWSIGRPLKLWNSPNIHKS